MTHYSGKREHNVDERSALRLTAVVLIVAIAAVIIALILCRTCEGDKVSAMEQADFERIAELVELKNGVLSERRYREQKESEEGEHFEDIPTEQADLQTGAAVPETEQGDPAEDAVLDDVQVVAETLRAELPARKAERRFSFVIGYQVIPDEILVELKARLTAHGIEQWLPIACAQMWQESKVNPSAENRNGLDKGLFQYRITYWAAVCVEHGLPAETSIFDWRAQIAVYTADVARRLRSGLSVEETISRHYTSDYGAYSAEYVQQIKQWLKETE